MRAAALTAALALTALLAAGCSAAPDLPSYGVVPDFQLTDQLGRLFRSAEKLSGNVWVANFIFTNCPGPCPRMSSQFRDLHRASAGAGVRFVSFTIDPRRDTPEVLAAYGRRWGADPDRWFFLTGAQADLHRLSRNVFLLGNVDGTLEHSTRFVLVDRHSRIRGFYDTSDKENIQKLSRDLDRLAASGA